MSIDLYQYLDTHVMIDWHPHHPTRVAGFLRAITEHGLFVETVRETPDFLPWGAILRVQPTQSGGDQRGFCASSAIRICREAAPPSEVAGLGLPTVHGISSANATVRFDAEKGIAITMPDDETASVWRISLQTLVSAAQVCRTLYKGRQSEG